MKKRKYRFDEGGSTGRFDEETYARARKFMEDEERRAGEGLKLDEEEPKAAAPKHAPVKKAPKAAAPAKEKPKAAPESAPKPAPVSTPKDSEPQYPTAAERFAQIKSAFKKRFGTQAMREANYAKGGSASSRADGCAKRGKTRGKMV